MPLCLFSEFRRLEEREDTEEEAKIYEGLGGLGASEFVEAERDFDAEGKDSTRLEFPEESEGRDIAK